jgi:RimJ/RimL family protein N-acetyltransferase
VAAGPFGPLGPLVGRHVRLDPLGDHHRDGLLAAAGEPGTAAPLTWIPTDAAQVAAYVEQALAEQDAGTSVPFATVALPEGRVVGSTRFLNLRRWDWSGATEGPDVAEIGATWLAASMRRTAVNSEAKLLQLTQAFDVWGVQRVELKTDARNLVSRQSIERLGARFEGVLRSYQPAADGPWPRDTAMYSILTDEWPAVSAGLRRALAR